MKGDQVSLLKHELNFSYSRTIAQKSGSSFYLSFFFLPKEKKEGMIVIYAFSRLVDDAVDEACDESTAQKEILLWRERVESCYGSTFKDAHPLLPELKIILERFHIPKSYLLDLITGMEMDLLKKRYDTYAELETYCYHVAGTIGLMCQHIFESTSEKAKEGAVLLGKAFQMTNIIRDVGSDLSRDRIYLPAEDMKKFSVTAEEVMSRKITPNLLALLSFESARAEDLYQRAFATIPKDELKKMKSALVMNAVYYKILKKLQKQNFPIFDRKVSLNFWEKIFQIFRVLL